MAWIKKKILPQYFKDIEMGNKDFELRKDEDNIQVGDILELKEWDGEKYTGKHLIKTVKYVLRNVPQYGLAEGYCIIGFHNKGKARKFVKNVLIYLGWFLLGAVIFGYTDSHIALAITSAIAVTAVML